MPAPLRQPRRDHLARVVAIRVSNDLAEGRIPIIRIARENADVTAIQVGTRAARKSARACDAGHIGKNQTGDRVRLWFDSMEAIMPRSINKFLIGAVAIGVAVVGASAIGIAAAQSSHEQTKTTTQRVMATVLKTEFRIGDRQQLRTIFLGGDRLR
jgi:hypothetical protein